MYPTISLSQPEDHFYQYSHLHGLPPFRIWGNLYYVGDDNVGIHLIDTGEGLILIDTGYPEMQGWLIQSIWQLGFRPEQIRYIIHSHYHFDHVGSTNLLKQLSPGVISCMSEVDARCMEDEPALIFADCHAWDYECFIQPDVLLKDGDTITLGNTRLWVKAAPGHTPGTLAIFCTVTDGKTEKVAGLHGGLGANTLSRAFMDKYQLGYLRPAFEAQMLRLMEEPVDITLCNHTKQTAFFACRKQLLEHPEKPNPFLNPSAWKELLSRYLQDFYTMCEMDP